MRGVTDALRSMVRQTDVVLNDGPAVLGEVYWADTVGGSPVYRWTNEGVAPGCMEVDELAWEWLRGSRLAPPEQVVVASRRFERRKLIFEPTADDIAAYSLPVSGATVASPGSLPAGAKNPWEVRWAAERGEVLYPFCRVNLSAAAATTASAHYYSITQPMTIECYPTDKASDQDTAIMLASGVLDTLTRGFIGEGVGDGHMRRVPLYDYEAVPLEEGVSQRRLPMDFLSVQDWSVRTLPDPTDLRRCAAIVDLRVSWRVSVDRHRGTRLVDSVNAVTAGS